MPLTDQCLTANVIVFAILPESLRKSSQILENPKDLPIHYFNFSIELDLIKLKQKDSNE